MQEKTTTKYYKLKVELLKFCKKVLRSFKLIQKSALESLEIIHLTKQKFQQLDKKINPKQNHDRFKRK